MLAANEISMISSTGDLIGVLSHCSTTATVPSLSGRRITISSSGLADIWQKLICGGTTLVAEKQAELSAVISEDTQMRTAECAERTSGEEWPRRELDEGQRSNALPAFDWALACHEANPIWRASDEVRSLRHAGMSTGETRVAQSPRLRAALVLSSSDKQTHRNPDGNSCFLRNAPVFAQLVLPEPLSQSAIPIDVIENTRKVEPMARSTREGTGEIRRPTDRRGSGELDTSPVSSFQHRFIQVLVTLGQDSSVERLSGPPEVPSESVNTPAAGTPVRQRINPKTGESIASESRLECCPDSHAPDSVSAPANAMQAPNDNSDSSRPTNTNAVPAGRSPNSSPSSTTPKPISPCDPSSLTTRKTSRTPNSFSEMSTNPAGAAEAKRQVVRSQEGERQLETPCGSSFVESTGHHIAPHPVREPRTEQAQRDAFDAVDRPAQPERLEWINAGMHRAEAAFRDPALGWISVRAELGSEGVRASVVPESSCAANVLGTHLTGLNAHLEANHVRVHPVTLSSEQGNQLQSGLGGGDAHQGHSDASQQNPRSSSPFRRQRDESEDLRSEPVGFNERGQRNLPILPIFESGSRGRSVSLVA